MPRRYFFFIFLFISLFLAALLFSIYYFNANTTKENNLKETDSKNTEKKDQLITYNICFPESLNEISINSENLKSDSKDYKVIINDLNQRCDITYSRNELTDSQYKQRIYSQLFIPVARYDSPIKEISSEELKTLLATEQLGSSLLLIDESLPINFNSNFPISTSVQPKITENIKSSLIADKNIIAIIPFEQMDPTLKLIRIQGQSPFDKIFNKETYPLLSQIWINGNQESVIADLTQVTEQLLGEENYQPEKMKDLIMSGTSILGGRTHWFAEKERGDPLFPIRGLADIFRNADIAHLSNEASFTVDCVQEEQTLSFCGTLASFEMMKFAGIDIVGVTANHELDKGRAAFESTLDLYNANGITYFGGGKDFNDAHTPKIIEINGIKIALLGYNFIPPFSYYSDQGISGTAQPDQNFFRDKVFMLQDIAKAKTMADFVILDMQWGEEYTHEPTQIQQEYGRAAIDAGANIINGVHPHYVQGLEYYKEGIIFYGLGNTLFDQLREDPLREAILVKHIFYGDKYLGYEMIPTVTEYNLQTVLAAGERKDRILNTIYQYSLFNR